MIDDYNEKVSSKNGDISDLGPHEITNRNDVSSNSAQKLKKSRFFQKFRNTDDQEEVVAVAKPKESVSLLNLFRYATKLDLILMLFGTASGLANGVILPIMIIVFGGILSKFTSRSTDACTLNFTALAIESCPEGYTLSASNYFSSLSICKFNLTFDLQSEITQQTLYLTGIGCASIVLSYFQV
ncbi:unnamed protein product, partial [Rotaria magnacalcarata]